MTIRNIDELPMADEGMEEYARKLLSTGQSADEYAAHNAHGWYCFSMDDYRYRDPLLQQWIHRLGDILFQRDGAPAIDELRKRYLTEDELKAVLIRAAEEL